jgi:hypothetical protein
MAYAGDICFSSCWLRGPFLPDKVQIQCQLSGSWLITVRGSCASLSVDVAGNRTYYVAPFLANWAVAMELAKSFTFVETIGQLVHIRNSDDNDFLFSFLQSQRTTEYVWLGGAEDDWTDGVYWSTFPATGVKFYNKTSPVKNHFTNFAEGQPGNTSGGLGVAFNINSAQWQMFLKRTTMFFVVFFNKMYNATNREEGPACGPIGYCNCRTFLSTVACEIPIIKVPTIPESTFSLRIVSQNLTEVLPSSLPLGLRILELTGNALVILPRATAPFYNLHTLWISVSVLINVL